MIAPTPHDEEGRLRSLRSTELLDTPPEAAFDVLTTAARKIAGTEIALVSLVDAERQWFKSRSGLEVSETPREVAFCAHAILGDEPFCVDDASQDPRFLDNPLVTGGPMIRAYAGAPIAVNGHNLGTVCAISASPRTWTPEVRNALTGLAAAAAEQMEMRRRLAFKDRLLRTISDGVVATDGEGRITCWTPAAERILGWPAADVMGRSILIIVPEAHRASQEEGFARMRRTGLDGFGGKPVPVNALHRDGHETPIELTLATWRNGADVTVAAIIRDCTERAALNEARSANAAKDRFLAAMSHEIRTPLNGLLGLAQVLSRTAVSSEQAEILRVMMRSGEALETVLSDVLECASLTTGDLKLKLGPTDVTGLLERVVLRHRPTADAKRLALSCSGPHGPKFVQADAARLEQMLSKLVGNAVKFTDRGVVRLIVRRPEADAWVFEITDTGPGFAPEIMAHLFEPFRPGDDTATRAQDGAGLGLALSQRLAREMGGDLRAENRPEGGARLILSLPMAACETPQALPSAAALPLH
jgi:PAS domain S-box-containing protein